MKYIKTYEQMPTSPIYKRLFNTYKVGDYVEFTDDVFNNKKRGKIIEIKQFYDGLIYTIELSNKETATRKKYITRKLTPMEIEDFEESPEYKDYLIGKIANKYNI